MIHTINFIKRLLNNINFLYKESLKVLNKCLELKFKEYLIF